MLREIDPYHLIELGIHQKCRICGGFGQYYEAVYSGFSAPEPVSTDCEGCLGLGWFVVVMDDRPNVD